MIASSAFGVEVNSFADPNNEFQRIANVIMNFTNWRFILKFFGYMFFPFMMNLFKIKMFDPEIDIFFTKTVIENMKYREKNGIVRNDMIHLLMQAKKGKLKTTKEENEENIVEGFATVEEAKLDSVDRKWSDEEIAAQAFIFFFAGFSTVSMTILS